MTTSHRSSDDPVIIAARMAVGHDGAAEAAITLRYPNGAERHVTFTTDSLAPQLDAAGLASLEELVGHPWTVLVPH